MEKLVIQSKTKYTINVYRVLVLTHGKPPPDIFTINLKKLRKYLPTVKEVHMDTTEKLDHDFFKYSGENFSHLGHQRVK